MVHYRGGAAAIDPEVYDSAMIFGNDLSAAYAEEVRRLGEIGCNVLQLDDTSLRLSQRPRPTQNDLGARDDADHQHLRYIKQINAADRRSARRHGHHHPLVRG